MSMTMSLLAQENAQAVAQGENKIDEKVERNTIRKGNGLFNDKKYTEAEIEYRKALEANPSVGNCNIQFRCGSILSNSRNGMILATNIEKSYKHRPILYEQHTLGIILETYRSKKKNYAQSIEEYKNALRRNPKDDETRYNLRLAQLLLKKQQQEQQNQDKNDDKDQQNKNKDQQKDQKQDQQEQNNNQNNQDKNKDQQEQNKPQQQQPQQSQMSKENAQQILDAIQQDERDTQEKVQKALMQQQKRKKTDKEW